MAEREIVKAFWELMLEETLKRLKVEKENEELKAENTLYKRKIERAEKWIEGMKRKESAKNDG